MTEPKKKRAPKAKTDDKPKNGQWKNMDRTTTFALTAKMREFRACIRFRCKKCNEPFIGIINHRDRVPKMCSVCVPSHHSVWSWALAS